MTPPGMSHLFQDAPEHGERRASNEGVVSVAITLMTKVDERLGRMESRLDELTRERREEAREQGQMAEQIKTLMHFKKTTEEGHQSNRRMAIAAMISAASALIIVIIKLIVLHPEVLR